MNIILKNMKNKLKKSKGFTLIEMLIVVAIIAILVAVAIPAVSSNLDKAKKSTDAANFRAAKAVAMIEYMGDSAPTSGSQYFNASEGKLQTSTTGAYKAQSADGHNKNDYIKVTFSSTTEPQIAWSST